ncbi:MAG: AraC family transcriptional regulator [Blautia sp.]|nr:AraC family transcriptional regulator [Blautia sp.]
MHKLVSEFPVTNRAFSVTASGPAACLIYHPPDLSSDPPPALALLLQENISITDVAYLSGFQSISNFSKVFRSTMHCSPMQYRKKHSLPSENDRLLYKQT